MSNDNNDDNNDIKIRVRPKITRRRSRKYGVDVIVVGSQPLPAGKYLTMETGPDGRLTLIEKRDAAPERPREALRLPDEPSLPVVDGQHRAAAFAELLKATGVPTPTSPAASSTTADVSTYPIEHPRGGHPDA